MVMYTHDIAAPTGPLALGIMRMNDNNHERLQYRSFFFAFKIVLIIAIGHAFGTRVVAALALVFCKAP